MNAVGTRQERAREAEEIFAREWVIDRNATRAALAAGITEKSAPVWGSVTLKKSNVKARIDFLLSRRASKLEIKAERVIEELCKLAFYDVRKLFDDDGSPLPISKLDDVTAAAIVGVDVEPLYEYYGKGKRREVGKIRKYRLADKGLNLERIGKHLKMFGSDQQQLAEALAGLAATIERARKQSELTADEVKQIPELVPR